MAVKEKMVEEWWSKGRDEWFGENRSQSKMEGEWQRVLNDL